MKISAEFHSHVRVLLKSQRAFHQIKRTSNILPQYNVLVDGIYLRRTALRNTFRNAKSRRGRSGVWAFVLSGVRALGCSIFQTRSVSEARSCDAGSWHLAVAKKGGIFSLQNNNNNVSPRYIFPGTSLCLLLYLPQTDSDMAKFFQPDYWILGLEIVLEYSLQAFINFSMLF